MSIYCGWADSVLRGEFGKAREIVLIQGTVNKYLTYRQKGGGKNIKRYTKKAELEDEGKTTLH